MQLDCWGNYNYWCYITITICWIIFLLQNLSFSLSLISCIQCSCVIPIHISITFTSIIIRNFTLPHVRQLFLEAHSWAWACVRRERKGQVLRLDGFFHSRLLAIRETRRAIRSLIKRSIWKNRERKCDTTETVLGPRRKRGRGDGALTCNDTSSRCLRTFSFVDSCNAIVILGSRYSGWGSAHRNHDDQLLLLSGCDGSRSRIWVRLYNRLCSQRIRYGQTTTATGNAGNRSNVRDREHWYLTPAILSPPRPDWPPVPVFRAQTAAHQSADRALPPNPATPALSRPLLSSRTSPGRKYSEMNCSRSRRTARRPGVFPEMINDAGGFPRVFTRLRGERVANGLSSRRDKLIATDAAFGRGSRNCYKNRKSDWCVLPMWTKFTNAHQSDLRNNLTQSAATAIKQLCPRRHFSYSVVTSMLFSYFTDEMVSCLDGYI